MKDILWMIYLSLLLILTYFKIFKDLQDIKNSLYYPDKVDIGWTIVISIMWAIWYMYFLH